MTVTEVEYKHIAEILAKKDSLIYALQRLSTNYPNMVDATIFDIRIVVDDFISDILGNEEDNED